jgi:hypothetical protein
MYELRNDGHTVSQHRTLDAAVKADMKLQRQVKKANGASSFLMTDVIHVHTVCGKCRSDEINADEYWAARNRLGL